MSIKNARLTRMAVLVARKLRTAGLSPLDRAQAAGLQVGRGCRIFMSDFGSEPWLIEIGSDTTISTGVKLLTHDGASCLAVDERGRRFLYGRVSIGQRCFIGANAIVMPGVTIGDDVIVGAGAIVTHSVGPGLVVAGNPAHTIGRTPQLIQSWLVSAPSERDRHDLSFVEFTTFCAERSLPRSWISSDHPEAPAT